MPFLSTVDILPFLSTERSYAACVHVNINTGLERSVPGVKNKGVKVTDRNVRG